MRAEEEVRKMLTIIEAFNQDGHYKRDVVALRWVLGEHPVQTGPTEPEAKPEPSMRDPNL